MSHPRDPGALVAGLRALLDALDDGHPVDARNVAASLRAAVDVLEAAPTWRTKTTAARELGVSLETVRGLCRRGKVARSWRHGRELVDLEDLRRVLAARRPQPTASGEHDAHSA